MVGPCLSQIEWNLDELRREQDHHPLWGQVKAYLKGSGTCPKRTPAPLTQFVIRDDDLLYRETTNYRGDKDIRIVIPNDEFKWKAFLKNHVLPFAGHGGRDATISRLERVVYWPNLRGDVARYVKSCHTCIMHKPARDLRVPIQKFPEVTCPWERVHADLIGPVEESEEGHKFVLTVIDVFTRYGIAIPLTDKSTKTVANAYIDHVISHYGNPASIVTDNGQEFLGEIFRSVQSVFRTKQRQIPIYHAASNGIVEKWNGTIIKILKTIITDNPKVWHLLIRLATLAYNTSYHRVLRDSPYFLLRKEDPFVPYDDFIKDTKVYYNLDDYKQRTLTIASRAFKTVEKCLRAEEAITAKYDKGKKKEIKIGDRVFVKNHRRKGKFSAWYVGPYRVLEQRGKVVFKLKHIASGKEKIFHADHLRKITENPFPSEGKFEIRNNRQLLRTDEEEPTTKAGGREMARVTDEPVPPHTHGLNRYEMIQQEQNTHDETHGEYPQRMQGEDIPEANRLDFENIGENEPQTIPSPTPHNYQLRSKGPAARHPLVMETPIEYRPFSSSVGGADISSTIHPRRTGTRSGGRGSTIP